MRRTLNRLQSAAAVRLTERRSREQQSSVKAVTAILQSTPALVHELRSRMSSASEQLSISAAQLVAGLSFRESTLHPLGPPRKHEASCPVQSGATLFNAFTEGHRCRYCAERRLHQLASEQLATDLCAKTQAPAATRRLPLPDSPLMKAIQKDFGSLETLQRDLMLFATSRRVPGRTYLVLNHTNVSKKAPTPAADGASSTPIPYEGKLQVFNMSQGQVPLSLGLVPLLAIDNTDAAWFAAYETLANTTTTTTAAAAPQWSRAHRNPQSAATREMPSQANGGGITMRDAKSYAASTAVGQIDWAFVEAQYERAVSRATSPATAESRAAMERAVKAKITSEAVRRWKAATAGAEEEESAVPPPAQAAQNKPAAAAKPAASTTTNVAAAAAPVAEEKATPAAAAASPTTATTAPDATAQPTTPEPTATGTATTSVDATASSSSAEAAPAETAAAAGEDDVATFEQLPDGTGVFHYRDGRKTFTRPDGTEEFLMAPGSELSRSVRYPNGSVEFFYANGAVTRVDP